MADALHVSDQNRQSGAEQLALVNFRRKWGVMDLLAYRTPIRKAAVLVDANRLLHDFDLLDHLRCLVARIELSAAFGTRTECIVPRTIEFVRQEGRSLVLRVTFLAPWLSLTPSSSASFALRLLDDIAGWWLRRIGRVFSSLGQLAFKLIDSLHQPFDQRRLFRDQSLQPLDLPVFGVHADHCRNSTTWRNTTYGVERACGGLQLRLRVGLRLRTVYGQRP